LTKESKVGGENFDAKAASAALGDVDGSPLAALDLMQHGLARDAEAFGGLGERNEPVGNGGHEAAADLVAQADPPGRVRSRLLAGQQAVTQPARS
jgi:hypothetical protein